MGNLKELHRVITSSGYEDNIYIPLELGVRCNAFKFVNESETATISITIKGKTITYPPQSRTDGEEKFEREWFSEIDIEASETGHKFQMGVYCDV